jgi:hypothetical protein
MSSKPSSFFVSTLVVALLLPTVVFGEDASQLRPAVYVQPECAGDDVGQKIASQLREDIKASRSMTAVDTQPDSVIRLNLVCQPPDPSEKGLISRYSYQITLTNPKGLYDFAMSHGVGTCGSGRVTECAESLRGNLDKMISELRSALQSGVFKLPK